MQRGCYRLEFSNSDQERLKIPGVQIRQSSKNKTGRAGAIKTKKKGPPRTGGMVVKMIFVTIKRNADGTANKNNLKKLARFFSEENLAKLDGELIYAVEEDVWRNGNPMEAEIAGYTFAAGETAARMGSDYHIGTVRCTGNGVVLEADSGYKEPEWGYKKALEILEKEF